MISTESRAALVLAFACLSLFILRYPVRLSNHLVLIWFVELVMLSETQVSRDASTTGVVGVLLLLTFGLAGLHKLNKAFMGPKSVAAQIASVFLIRNGVSAGKSGDLARRVPLLTVLAELSAPMLVLFGTGTYVALAGLVALLLLSIGFAMLGHLHFGFALLALFIAIDGGVSWPTLDLSHADNLLQILVISFAAFVGARNRIWKGFHLSVLLQVTAALFCALATVVFFDMLSGGDPKLAVESPRLVCRRMGDCRAVYRKRDHTVPGHQDGVQFRDVQRPAPRQVEPLAYSEAVVFAC